MSNWFETIFGFNECPRGGKNEAKSNFTLAGTVLTSKHLPGRPFEAGTFTTPSLEELRHAVKLEEASKKIPGQLRAQEITGDVSEMHTKRENAFALFQAASQFNCLEHTSERGLPEHGITCYSGDHTQGPACATACAPGTVVRNYFAFNGEREQSKDRQVTNLLEVEQLLDNEKENYFKVLSGYTLSSPENLLRLTKRLQNPALLERMHDLLRIGVQADTEVVSSGFGGRVYKGEKQIVTQVYGSACSVSYSRCSAASWECFAQAILRSSYESTLYVAVQNALRHPDEPGAKKVFLTALGGGVFGNDMKWVENAISEALHKFRDIGLHVIMVSYGGSTPEFERIARAYSPE